MHAPELGCPARECRANLSREANAWSFKGEYRIAAPRDQVWVMLNDPDVLRECIPGCEVA